MTAAALASLAHNVAEPPALGPGRGFGRLTVSRQKTVRTNGSTRSRDEQRAHRPIRLVRGADRRHTVASGANAHGVLAAPAPPDPPRMTRPTLSPAPPCAGEGVRPHGAQVDPGLRRPSRPLGVRPPLRGRHGLPLPEAPRCRAPRGSSARGRSRSSCEQAPTPTCGKVRRPLNKPQERRSCAAPRVTAAMRWELDPTLVATLAALVAERTGRRPTSDSAGLEGWHRLWRRRRTLHMRPCHLLMPGADTSGKPGASASASHRCVSGGRSCPTPQRSALSLTRPSKLFTSPASGSGTGRTCFSVGAEAHASSLKAGRSLQGLAAGWALGEHAPRATRPGGTRGKPGLVARLCEDMPGVLAGLLDNVIHKLGALTHAFARACVRCLRRKRGVRGNESC